MKAFLARDSNGLIFLYHPNPPIKEKKIWIKAFRTDTLSAINKDLFSEVKWEDEEPTEINIEIVNKHQ